MKTEILRVDQVSELTGVPVATLRWYRASGKGPKLWKLGGRIVAYREDVLQWIQEEYEASLTGESNEQRR